jgi:hypothetical protein
LTFSSLEGGPTIMDAFVTGDAATGARRGGNAPAARFRQWG